MEYRTRQLGRKERFLGIGLSSRKNMCIHPVVSKERHGAVVDAKCMNLTASWLRGSDANEHCDFFEVGHDDPINGLLT
jgi:DNA excision repair protein ERCC-2